jgi:hypothetical protein
MNIDKRLLGVFISCTEEEAPQVYELLERAGLTTRGWYKPKLWAGFCTGVKCHKDGTFHSYYNDNNPPTLTLSELRAIVNGDASKQTKYSGSLISDEEIQAAADEWVFDKNGMKWSNNDNTAGDNYGSFVAGVKWASSRIGHKLTLLEEIDEFLAYIEDFIHGQDGDRITELRRKIGREMK